MQSCGKKKEKSQEKSNKKLPTGDVLGAFGELKVSQVVVNQSKSKIPRELYGKERKKVVVQKKKQ